MITFGQNFSMEKVETINGKNWVHNEVEKYAENETHLGRKMFELNVQQKNTKKGVVSLKK